MPLKSWRVDKEIKHRAFRNALEIVTELREKTSLTGKKVIKFEAFHQGVSTVYRGKGKWDLR